MTICAVTIIPPHKVAFPNEISKVTNSVKLLVSNIYRYPPSFKWARKLTNTPGYEIQSSTLLCSCSVSSCSETYVFVFYIIRMNNFLNTRGAVLIKKQFSQKIGKVITRQGISI